MASTAAPKVLSLVISCRFGYCADFVTPTGNTDGGEKNCRFPDLPQLGIGDDGAILADTPNALRTDFEESINFHSA